MEESGTIYLLTIQQSKLLGAYYSRWTGGELLIRRTGEEKEYMVSAAESNGRICSYEPVTPDDNRYSTLLSIVESNGWR